MSDTATGEDTARRQVKAPIDESVAIDLHLQGLTIRAIADELGCSKDRIHRLLHRPDVARLIEDARRESIQRAKNRVTSMATKAFATVERVLDDERASDRDRLKAAEITLKTLGISDLADEVSKTTGTDGSAAKEGLRTKLQAMLDRGEIIEATARDVDDDDEDDEEEDGPALAVVE